MFLTSLALLLGIASWMPPTEPDPSSILNGASQDTREGRYADALAKHVWYHEHALEHEPAQYGVRLSFALMYWKELAEKYPPALDAMRAARDRAEAKIGEGKAGFGAFHDYQSLNENLDEEQRTLDRFLELRQEAPEVAEQAYRIVEPLLIKAEQYAICGEYVDPSSARAALAGQQLALNMAADAGEGSQRVFMQRSADERLSQQAATLVALLVLNDREDEAAEIAELVRPKLTKKIDLRRIDAALEGKPPKPR